MKATIGVTTGVLALASCVGCCKDETIQHVASPSKTHHVRVSYRDCGATTSEYTHVDLGSQWSVGETIFSARYEQRIELEWITDSELTIRCYSCKTEDIKHQISKLGPIRINYEFVPHR